MELHEALKTIVASQGKQILCNPRLLNMLADYKAFENQPAYKFVLRTIVAEGYCKELLAMTSPGTQLISLVTKVNTLTGIQLDMLQSVFNALAYSIGFLNAVSGVSASSVPNLNAAPLTNVNPGNHHGTPLHNPLTDQSSDQEIADYLNSVLVVDQDSFDKRGLVVKSLSQLVSSLHSDTYYNFNYNIISKESCKISCYLTLFSYDMDGCIRDCNLLSCIYLDENFESAFCSDKIQIDYSPLKISKLLLKVEDSSCYGSVFIFHDNVELYKGPVENRIGDSKILMSQIIYASDELYNKISVRVRIILSELIKKIIIELYDKHGGKRQNFYLDTHLLKAWVEYGFIGNDFKLLFPFEDIGKVVFKI